MQVVLVIVLCKLILVPLATLALLWMGASLGINPNDKLLLLVVVLQSASPTAMSFNVLCQMVGTFTKEAPRMLLYVYVVSALTMTVFCAAAIAVLKAH